MKHLTMHSKASQRGMTLLEVLVALVVFAYAALTLVSTSTANLNALSRLENKTLASWVAQNQLTTYLLEAQTSEGEPKKKVTGQSQMAGQTFFFELKLRKTGNDWIRAVTVNVSLDEAGAYPLVTLTSYVES